MPGGVRQDNHYFTSAVLLHKLQESNSSGEVSRKSQVAEQFPRPETQIFNNNEKDVKNKKGWGGEETGKDAKSHKSSHVMAW